MSEPVWRLAAWSRQDDRAVAARVRECFGEIAHRHFGTGWLANHELPIDIRAFRRSDGWSVFLLLTPWMMARMFLPERDPGLQIPSGWTSTERTDASFQVIGPLLAFTMLGVELKAHLNYHAELGHFLLQPLVLAMEKYRSADEVFAAWNEVIGIRDRAMEEYKRECGWQQEVSRREFFSVLTGSGKARPRVAAPKR